MYDLLHPQRVDPIDAVAEDEGAVLFPVLRSCDAPIAVRSQETILRGGGFRDVQKLGDCAATTLLNDTPERSGRGSGRDRLFNDVDDSADKESDYSFAMFMNDDLDRFSIDGRSNCSIDGEQFGDVDERHDRTAVLNDHSLADPFDRRTRELFSRETWSSVIAIRPPPCGSKTSVRTRRAAISDWNE